MKKFELIMGLLALLAIILKVLHISGGDILLSLSLSLLALFYYLSFALLNGIRLRDIFKSTAYQHTNPKRILGAIGLGLALSTIIMGALFKLLFLPGAMAQLKFGLLFLGMILIVAVFFFFQNKIDYYKGVFKRIAVIGGIGLTLFLTPTASLVDFFYRDNPDYAESYKQVLADPENQELREKLEAKREELDE